MVKKEEKAKKKISKIARLKEIAKEFKKNAKNFFKEVGAAGTGQQARIAKRTSKSLKTDAESQYRIIETAPKQSDKDISTPKTPLQKPHRKIKKDPRKKNLSPLLNP